MTPPRIRMSRNRVFARISQMSALATSAPRSRAPSRYESTNELISPREPSTPAPVLGCDEFACTSMVLLAISTPLAIPAAVWPLRPFLHPGRGGIHMDGLLKHDGRGGGQR